MQLLHPAQKVVSVVELPQRPLLTTTPDLAQIGHCMADRQQVNGMRLLQRMMLDGVSAGCTVDYWEGRCSELWDCDEGKFSPIVSSMGCAAGRSLMYALISSAALEQL